MVKSFNVAGHVFRLIIPDGHPVWGALGNYAPFEVESREALFELEVVNELDPGQTERVLLSDDPDEPDMSMLDLRHSAHGWYVEMQPTRNSPVSGRFTCNEDFTRGRLKIESRTLSGAAYSVNNALMILYAFKTSTLGTLEMHSSVVVNDGRAYMFLGKSGTGKSTHSRLWMENIEGTWLLNDDNPIVRSFPDGQVRVYGSPWSGKTPCYKLSEAPVGAIVQIRQCPENKIEKMSVSEAYAAIFSSSSGLKVLPGAAEGFFKTISSVVTAVPCFLLDCLPDAEAARLCHSTTAK